MRFQKIHPFKKPPPNGTVFSLSFTPMLTLVLSGANVLLTWPTNVAGFDYTGYTLQTTTNLVSPIWTDVPATPAVVNGHVFWLDEGETSRVI